MSKKPATKAEKAHMGKVQSLHCLVCRRPAEIHHARNRTGKKRDHLRVIPLCPAHHRHDAVSVHGMYPDKFRQLYGDEIEMLEDVQRQLGRRETWIAGD